MGGCLFPDGIGNEAFNSPGTVFGGDNEVCASLGEFTFKEYLGGSTETGHDCDIHSSGDQFPGQSEERCQTYPSTDQKSFPARDISVESVAQADKGVDNRSFGQLGHCCSTIPHDLVGKGQDSVLPVTDRNRSAEEEPLQFEVDELARPAFRRASAKLHPEDSAGQLPVAQDCQFQTFHIIFSLWFSFFRAHGRNASAPRRSASSRSRMIPGCGRLPRGQSRNSGRLSCSPAP